MKLKMPFDIVLITHTPLSRVVNFLKNIKTNNLMELYEDPDVPSSTKPFIYSELLDRERS